MAIYLKYRLQWGRNLTVAEGEAQEEARSAPPCFNGAAT